MGLHGGPPARERQVVGFMVEDVVTGVRVLNCFTTKHQKFVAFDTTKFLIPQEFP